MASKKQRRVLFIAFPFPPSRGGGVFRTVATANYLARHGWKVIVVAPEEEYFARYQGSEDRSLLDWISPRIEVQRVQLTNWLREDDLRRKSLVSVLLPSWAAERVSVAQRYLSPLDHYPFWVWPAMATAIKIAVRIRIDVILATGNPFSSFLVAGLVGQLMGIPYVLDYRDAWTLDQFSGDLKPQATDTALAIERRLLHKAAGVVSVNRAIVDWLTRTHSLPRTVQKRVVENGYDPEFVNVDDLAGPATANMGGPRFTYVGTIIPKKLDWLQVLTTLDGILAYVAPEARLDMFGHLGFSTPQAAELRRLFENHDRIAYRGPVSKANVSEVYRGSDVLFLPMYDSPYVTSGKVYEMMATGKPILAWGKKTAGALVPLSGYPKLVFADSANPRSLADAVSAAVHLARHAPPQLDEAAKEYSRRFERGRQLKAMAGLLDAIASEDSVRRGRHKDLVSLAKPPRRPLPARVARISAR